jgi:hypothetical protein
MIYRCTYKKSKDKTLKTKRRKQNVDLHNVDKTNRRQDKPSTRQTVDKTNRRQDKMSTLQNVDYNKTSTTKKCRKVTGRKLSLKKKSSYNLKNVLIQLPFSWMNSTYRLSTYKNRLPLFYSIVHFTHCETTLLPET